jgi:AraC-like DNA-binding protein
MRIVRHESRLGRHELAWATPAPALREWVHQYAGWLERSPQPLARRELPSGEVPLVIGFGQRLRVSGPTLERRGVHDSFLAGLHDSYVTTEFDGISHGVQVKLTPLGASALLGTPMCELTNRVVALDDVLGHDAELLAERLHDAASWPRRFEILDALVTRRLARSSTPPAAVRHAWRRLTETAGQIPVGELSRELGASRPYLIRRFHEHVGMPPKKVARILRLQRALAAQEGGAAWADAAIGCGYFDQSHLDRDCRELAGASPTRLAASRLPDGIGLAG